MSGRHAPGSLRSRSTPGPLRGRRARGPLRSRAVGAALAANRPSLVVAVLAAALGTLVVMASAASRVVLLAGDRTGTSATVALLLPVVSWVFIAVSLYVATVVTVNTCATMITGRTRELALLRLLGSTATGLRRDVTRDGVVVGLVGGTAGAVAGLALANVALTVAGATDVLPPTGVLLPPASAVVVLAVVVSTVLAFRVCSRRVLALVPLQALSASTETDGREALRRGRFVAAVVLFALGGVGLLGSIVFGSFSYLLVYGAVGAGFVSFSGVVLGAPYVLPPAFRLVATGMSGVPMAVLAGRNALRSPARASRAAVGLLIAVTLIVTFSVGLATYEHMLTRQMQDDPYYYRGIHEQFVAISTMFTALVAASGIIAAVGVVNVSALTVAQRGREFGLLRTIGATRRQVVGLVTVETVVTVVTALVAGLVLGAAYGWTGAYALLGTTHGARLTAPVLPLGTVVVVLVGSALVAFGALVGPARRAVRPAPVVALAVE